MLRRTKNYSTAAGAIICLFLSCLASQAQPASELGKIEGDVVINFAAEQLSAKLKYDYVAVEDRNDSLVFYLSPAFDVSKVRCDVCESFVFDRQTKPDPSLTVKLKKPLRKGKRLTIHVEYSGSLKDMT